LIDCVEDGDESAWNERTSDSIKELPGLTCSATASGAMSDNRRSPSISFPLIAHFFDFLGLFLLNRIDES
jgi:hypothetical protein